MEDIGSGEYRFRGIGSPLDQIVVVCIHAGYHIFAHPLLQQVHQHRLLAPFQLLGARGQRHLEVDLWGFQSGEHRAPEKHIIVALHIGYDAVLGRLRIELIGRFEVL